MPKLQSLVSDALDTIISTVKLKQGCTRTVALEYLIHLARLKPKHARREFSGEAKKNCTLHLSQDEMGLFVDYRTSHTPLLDTQGEFFRAALAQGASLYADGFRLSDQRKFENCTLIPPGQISRNSKVRANASVSAPAK